MLEPMTPFAIEWTEHARATASLDRAHFLSLRLRDGAETRSRFVNRFLEPPLFQTRYDHGWGTLYTATYDPLTRQANYLWPSYSLQEDFTDFQERNLAIRFNTPG